MLTLSAETETLAERIAAARHVPVEAAIRHALEAEATRLPTTFAVKDVTEAAIAERRARTQQIVADIAALPVLDPRPIADIVADLNEL
jgi:antitoxin VapB